MNISIFTDPEEEKKNKSGIGGDKNSFPLSLTQDQARSLFSRQSRNGKTPTWRDVRLTPETWEQTEAKKGEEENEGD